jgi:hypothetical protein
MRAAAAPLALALFATAIPAAAQVSDDEIQAMRSQIEMLTRRLDELEKQNQAMARSLQEREAPAAVADAGAGQTAVISDAALEERIDQAVDVRVDERMAAVSWAERVRWKGDFRYRYENIDEEGKDGRNRSRIRARTNLEAQVSPTLDVGVGLATGGDDPVSSNQTIGGGGSSKDIKIDLAYFDWSGLQDTNIVGGKFKNFLVRPEKRGLIWDSDWRPEGLGIVWDNGTFFAHGLGTWLEGDSKNRTQFSWVVQGGVNLDVGETGQLKFGAGYNQFDIAGRTPLFGDPEDFYGNSFVFDPVAKQNVFEHNYRQYQLFAGYKFKLGGRSLSLFADYTQNTEVSENDTAYLIGAKYGSAKDKGDWDFIYFYERIEADSTVGLLADSDFGGGGTDSKGHAFIGTYAFHKAWYFRATYFLNEIKLASGNPRDYDRLMLDLAFKF